MPTILLAQEDPEAAANLAALLREFFPTAILEPLSDFAALTTALTSNRRAALLLTDIFWADQNRAEEILLLAEADPEISVGLISRFDLSGTLPAAFPIPCLLPWLSSWRIFQVVASAPTISFPPLVLIRWVDSTGLDTINWNEMSRFSSHPRVPPIFLKPFVTTPVSITPPFTHFTNLFLLTNGSLLP